MQIRIILSKQELILVGSEGRVIKTYPCSTSVLGAGNRKGSGRTPLGRHIIAAKHGRNAPLGMIFRSRRATGKIARIDQDIDQDQITSRILRLAGTEQGINKAAEVDSFDRYIYIHGTNDEKNIGHPASHGCIRMRNRDIIELFDWVKRGTPVFIEP